MPHLQIFIESSVISSCVISLFLNNPYGTAQISYCQECSRLPCGKFDHLGCTYGLLSCHVTINNCGRRIELEIQLLTNNLEDFIIFLDVRWPCPNVCLPCLYFGYPLQACQTLEYDRAAGYPLMLQ